MTINEASERYSIPLDILKEYESWGLCGAVKKVMGAWQYDTATLNASAQFWPCTTSAFPAMR